MEELDNLDWPRFLRAVEAGHIGQIEERRIMQMRGLLKTSDLTADEWEQVRRHDALIEE